jgi:hypothetical protein
LQSKPRSDLIESKQVERVGKYQSTIKQWAMMNNFKAEDAKENRSRNLRKKIKPTVNTKPAGKNSKLL